MWNLLLKIKKNLILSILSSMTLGLLFGYYFNLLFLKILILPLTIMMIYPMMINIKISELANIKNYKLHLTMLSINFLLIPFIGLFLGKIFFPNNMGLALGLILMSLLPTSGMTISWTGFANGKIDEAIKMTVIGLILGSLSIPIYIKLFFGQSISISLFSIIKQISQVVFIPLIAGQITRILIVKNIGVENYSKNWKKKFPLLSTIGLLLIIFISMALKSKNIINNPTLILSMIMPILLFYLINFSISSLAGKFLFEKSQAIALVYGTSLRNLSLAMALSITLFKDYSSIMILIISISYIFQVQIAASYLKISDKILHNPKKLAIKTID